MLNVGKDLKVILNMLKPENGSTHSERLENFYQGQADNYDHFRKKLLPGRDALIKKIEIPENGTWADLGCGTGYNLESMGFEKSQKMKQIFLVDLSSSLLEKAAERSRNLGLNNVEIYQEDVCLFNPEVPLDLITFSYSLTMIPQWYKALENALQLLKPGGVIAVVDFYVAQKHPQPGMQPHSAWTRNFWPMWFSWDNVRLNPDHLPYLMDKFETIEIFEGTNLIAYAPFGLVPYYLFIGKKLER